MKQILILKEPLGAITESSSLFNNIKKIDIDYKQENFLLFCLNSKNKVIHSEVIFKGGLNSCIICPKVLFRKALKYNSNSVIIAHNHPSGDLNPSDEDLSIFKKLKDSGDILQLSVLDSIIFNKKEYYSLLNGG